MFLRRTFGRLSTKSTLQLTGKDLTSFLHEKRLFLSEEFDSLDLLFYKLKSYSLLCVHQRVQLTFIMQLSFSFYEVLRIK